ncbi:MAG: hypothetical protein ACI80M_001304 [Gammaproteobacteria bacterium]|jgi:hypothetical protein|tara:strand:+ start:1418 stop:1816 length:399 start_codon:yes stop_codon:yes gene_type:complete
MNMNAMLKNIWVATAVTILTACAGLYDSPDYVRHTNSALLDGLDGSDMLQFQAKAGSQYPESDPAAEALRMSWLEGWLKQSKKCKDGYVIKERREFGFAEYNPAGYNLVYELECKVQMPAGVDIPTGEPDAG